MVVHFVIVIKRENKMQIILDKINEFNKKNSRVPEWLITNDAGYIQILRNSPAALFSDTMSVFEIHGLKIAKEVPKRPEFGTPWYIVI
jgi:hypothetical protein